MRAISVPKVATTKSRAEAQRHIDRLQRKLDALSLKGEHSVSGSEQWHAITDEMAQYEDQLMGFGYRAAARKGTL